MKESYFTSTTIQRKAREMSSAVAVQVPRRASLAFRPEAAALLILDMQAYFLHPESHAFIPSAPTILPGLRSLSDAFAARGRPVILTRHLNTPQDAAMMARWWRDLIRPDSPESEIAPELRGMGDVVLPKSQYDAFYHTPLEETLRARDVRQVVVTGVMTHLCCETTARSAFVRGFEVFFVVDGTATYNEAFHRATLLTLAHGFATLVLADELRDALEALPHE